MEVAPHWDGSEENRNVKAFEGVTSDESSSTKDEGKLRNERIFEV